MTFEVTPGLNKNLTPGAKVIPIEPDGWRLEVPTGPSGKYRVAQLDDYCGQPRRDFHWRPPFHLKLEARASKKVIPGTWGFGLWNDPFGIAIMGGKRSLYLPTLPNAAWFFFASQPNYLSIRDDLPAQGGLAATFRAATPSALLAPAALCAPLLLFPPAVRFIRRLARRIVHQDAISLSFDPSQWHDYEMNWQPGQVVFMVDGEQAFQTIITPHGPLGLVIWVDNQYAAVPPTGRLAYGTLAASEVAWIELRNLKIT